MSTSRAIQAFHALPQAQRLFLLFAAVVAVVLLWLYVQLLHTSLARGHELREMQRIAAVTKGGSAAAQRPRAALGGAIAASFPVGAAKTREFGSVNTAVAQPARWQVDESR